MEGDVLWRGAVPTPKADLPVGNGEVVACVTVDRWGLLLELGRSDSWSAQARLLKAGALRVRLDPPLPIDDALTIRLDLATATVVAQAPGLEVRVRVDADVDVVRVTARGFARVEAELDRWRSKERRLEDGEWFSAYGASHVPGGLIETADEVAPATDRLPWWHANRSSVVPAVLELQGLSLPDVDPLARRITGGVAGGTGWIRSGDLTLEATPAPQVELLVAVHTEDSADVDTWRAAAEALLHRAQEPGLDQRHDAAWQSFWARSHLRVSGAPEGEAISDGYARQRYLVAIAGRGRCPVKFNGGTFVTAQQDLALRFDADFRLWGGAAYFWQNNRLVHWPMLGTGDVEVVDLQLQLYVDALPRLTEWVRRHHGHAGAAIPEVMFAWGSPTGDDFGWHRSGQIGIDNPYTQHHWTATVEVPFLALERYAHRPDEAFLHSVLVPLLDACLTWYDEHYPRVDGVLRLAPAQALESYHDVVDPMPDVAGLTAVLARAVRLPVDDERRRRWSRLAAELPPLPQQDGVLLPGAEVHGERRNVENPELYAVWPYGLYGVGRPDLETGRRTYAARRHRQSYCWTQSDVQAAVLGLADEAARGVASRFATANPSARFQGYWGPHHDWVPDLDHGGVGMLALQAMLLQPVGDRLHLLPAWPASWDAEFRLHTHGDAVVVGEVRAGELVQCEVEGGTGRRWEPGIDRL